MIELKNFQPFEYATIPATTTSANVAFTTNVGKDLRIHNTGTALVYVTWGNGAAQTATSTTGMSLSAGQREIVYTGGINNVAAIAAAGSSAVTVARGDGSFGGG
jgi:hypothetical protein